MFSHVRKCVSACIRARLCACVSVRVCASVWACDCVRVSKCERVYVHACMYMFVDWRVFARALNRCVYFGGTIMYLKSVHLAVGFGVLPLGYLLHATCALSAFTNRKNHNSTNY